MSVAVRSQSTTLGTSTASPLTITKPVGLAVGDIMLCTAWFSSATPGGVSPPSGFTLIDSASYATAGSNFYWWWKRADATDVAAASFTVTWTDTNTYYIGGTILAVSGGPTSGTPFDFGPLRADPASQTEAITTTPAITGTTVTAGALVVLLGMGNQATAITPPAGYTLSSTPDIMSFCTKVQGAAGTTGSLVATYNVTGVTAAGLLGIPSATPPGPATPGPSNFTMAAVQRASTW